MKDRHRMFRRHAQVVVGTLFAAALVLAAACANDQAIVGGVCAPSYTQCGSHCVDLSNDPANCGGCGIACIGAECANGQCQVHVSGDGASGDGPSGDGASGDGLRGDGPSGDGDDGASSRDGRGRDHDAFGLDEDSPSADSSLDGVGPDGSGTTGEASLDGPSVDSTLDGTAGDGALPDGASGDGPLTDATSADGASSDASTSDGSSDDVVAADACVPPYDTPAHCGSCTNRCSPPLPFCALVGSTFTCVPDCTPLTDCAGSCTDLTTDPLNCGVCGKVCPSQICGNSTCIGSIAGDLLVIGHDYANALAGTSQARVLSNAVFLWPYDPIHVLSYERYADPTVVARIKALLLGAANRFGRTLDIRSTMNDSDVTGSLSTRNFGVLLIADQVNAQGASLGALGASWAPVLSAFTAAGGVVVVLDGGSGAMQMPALITGTGLLTVSAQAALAPGTDLGISAPADAVSLGVLSPYAAASNSVTFTTEPAAGAVTYVVEPVGDGGPRPPVVVHKVF